MTNEVSSAATLLESTSISILDAARLVKNILDFKPAASNLSDIEFCSRIIETGKRNLRTKEMSLKNGFMLYLESKRHLRPDSFKDIKYLGQKILKTNSEFSCRNFSDLSAADCETAISLAFHTPSQYNKARTMLHGLFEFALRREWCDKNAVKLVERKKNNRK